MRILLPYAPGLPRTVETLATYFLLKTDILIRWDTFLTPCTKPDDYEKAVKQVWGLDDLLIWEHDIIPTLTMLEDLAACPWPVCAQAYKLYPATTVLPAPAYAHRRTACEFINEGDEFCNLVGFGLTKISLDVQNKIDPNIFDVNTWRSLDTVFSLKMLSLGIRAHVHWPEVRHNHR